MVFENRQEAGDRLAGVLAHYRNLKPLILVLPRGGVPIGFEIAEILEAPLEVIVSRKIGAPHNPEFGIGAIAEGNVTVLDTSTIKLLEISKKDLKDAITIEKAELRRRVALYRKNKPLPQIRNQVIIVVDDGLATGITARAAILAIKKKKPKQVIFASPVCAYDTARELESMVDTVVCVTTPLDFIAVGLWYRSFSQVSDEEVIELLEKSRRRELPVVGIHYAEPGGYMHHGGG